MAYQAPKDPGKSRLILKTINRTLAASSLSKEQKAAIRSGYLWHDPAERTAVYARLDPRIVSLWYHKLSIQIADAMHSVS